MPLFRGKYGASRLVIISMISRTSLPLRIYEADHRLGALFLSLSELQLEEAKEYENETYFELLKSQKK